MKYEMRNFIKTTKKMLHRATNEPAQSNNNWKRERQKARKAKQIHRRIAA